MRPMRRHLIASLVASVVALTLVLPTGVVPGGITMAHAATQDYTLARNVAIQAGSTTYPNPTTTPQGFAVPAGDLSIVLDGTNAPATDAFTVTLDISYDGGSTWQMWVAIGFNGGTYLNRQGQPVGTHGMGGYWPGGNARVTVTATQGATISVTASLVTG